MSLSSLIERWQQDPSIGPNIASWLTVPARQPQWVDFPDKLHPRLLAFLKVQGFHHLYHHQLRCWQLVHEGKNVLISTGTSSGKSLAYQLPVIDDILRPGRSRALFLYPTKALARDQLAWLNEFPDIKASPYDGDTPQHQRKSLRECSDIIISNPDMLHLGILPYHTLWVDFFANLKYVILDEVHIYRGVFGSHVANLLRRLKRITSHYGAKPTFILASATIGNPLQFGKSLLEEELILIDEDTSSRGEKHVVIYNPPIIDPKFGLRASMHQETIRLADDLISTGLQTIIFGKSRRSVEFLLTRLIEMSPAKKGILKAYRSGYLPKQRRDLEEGLRSGDIRGITATTALELGVDIGGLDAAVLAGFPGTISGTWQQAGRSGRGDAPSLSLILLSSNPLDQYIALHPDYLVSSLPESALIDPDNLLIALAHIKCALYELPFTKGESYGAFNTDQTFEFLSILESMGMALISGDQLFWMSDDYPASDLSLRSTSPHQIILQLINSSGQTAPLGTIDQESALWMIHPGAVYLHQGEPYFVEDLDLQEHKAALTAFEGDYYTEAIKKVDFESINPPYEEPITGGAKFYGEIKVTHLVSGYKKINWKRFEVLGTETLDLPPVILNTMGFWINLSESTEFDLRDSGSWNSSPNDYGPNWKDIRKQILSRDKYICALCGQSFPDSSLHVHHKIPLRAFSSLESANQPDNLISLCPRCHQRAETVVKVNSGVRGLGYLLHNLAPLLLMCDPGDLGLHADFKSQLSSSRPFVLIYENIPAGLGFSQFLFENIQDILTMASDVVGSCPCESGCPACVGPGGELGSGGKQETIAILDILCG